MGKPKDEILKKLAVAIEQSPMTIVITDADGNVEYTNPFFTTLTGYKFEEVKGQNLRILKSGKHDPEIYKNLWETITSGKTWHGELCNKKKDGSLYWESIFISPVRNEKKKIISFIAIKENISELKKTTDELLVAKDTAEEANKAKSNFLANMSHELRTPMNAILGTLYLLQKTSLNKKQEEYTDKIQKASQNLLDIINDILDITKIESNQLTIEKVKFNLRDVIDDLTSMTIEKTREKQIDFSISIERNVPIYLIGDPLRIGQILLNLTNNAIKFTDQGGVSVHVSSVKKEDTTATLLFMVKDTGIGMSSEQLDYIFESFTQADTSPTRKFGGIGLGLTICKSLVNKMGGEISVASYPDIGSSFSFTIKLEQQAINKEWSTALPDYLQKIRILLVTTNNKESKFIFQYLKDFSFDTYKISKERDLYNELKTSQKKEESRYDLVILDWKFLSTKTVQKIEQIKSDPEIKKMPRFIVYFEDVREEIFYNIESKPFDASLISPINQSILFDTILNLFSDTIYLHDKFSGTVKYENKLKEIRLSNILLVEDNKMNQQMVTDFLNNEGFFVTIANNGKEAIEVLEKSDQSYDLILMDLHMPEMNGYETATVIKNSDKLKTIPIIAMTADAKDEVKDKVANAGMSDSITKPMSPEQLFKLICRWIVPKKRHGILASQINQRKTVKKVIPMLEGLNVVEGSKFFSGDINAYKDLLNEYYQNNKKWPVNVIKAFEDNNRDLISLLIHNLKGISGYIGAYKLYNKIILYNESKITNESDKNLKKYIDEVISELKTVLSSIKNLDDSNYTKIQFIDHIDKKIKHNQKPTDKVKTELKSIEPIFKKLEHLLSESKTEACRYFIKHQEYISKYIDPDINSQLTKEIKNYNYKKSLEIINSVTFNLKRDNKDEQ